MCLNACKRIRKANCAALAVFVLCSTAEWRVAAQCSMPTPKFYWSKGRGPGELKGSDCDNTSSPFPDGPDGPVIYARSEKPACKLFRGGEVIYGYVVRKDTNVWACEKCMTTVDQGRRAFMFKHASVNVQPASAANSITVSLESWRLEIPASPGGNNLLLIGGTSPSSPSSTLSCYPVVTDATVFKCGDTGNAYLSNDCQTVTENNAWRVLEGPGWSGYFTIIASKSLPPDVKEATVTVSFSGGCNYNTCCVEGHDPHIEAVSGVSGTCRILSPEKYNECGDCGLTCPEVGNLPVCDPVNVHISRAFTTMGPYGYKYMIFARTKDMPWVNVDNVGINQDWSIVLAAQPDSYVGESIDAPSTFPWVAQSEDTDSAGANLSGLYAAAANSDGSSDIYFSVTHLPTSRRYTVLMNDLDGVRRFRGTVEIFDFDDSGALVKVMDSVVLDGRRAYSFDPRQANGPTLYYHYSSTGELTRTSVEGGGLSAQDVAEMGYDANGRLTKLTDGCASCGMGGGGYYEYDDNNKITVRRDAEGRIIERNQFDSSGRVVSQSAGSPGSEVLKMTTEYNYDPALNTLRVTTKDFVTNSEHRAVVEEYPGRTANIPTKTYVYETLNPDLTAGGHCTTYSEVRDSNGQLQTTYTVSPTSITRNKYYETDPTSANFGQVTLETIGGVLGAGELKVAEYEYYSPGSDGIVRMHKVIDGNLGTKEYTYSDTSSQSGLLSQMIEPAYAGTSQVSEYQYDPRARVTLERQKGPNGAWVTKTYRYDAVGNLTQTAEFLVAGLSERVTTYQYDAFSNQTRTRDAAGYIEERSYTINGNLTSKCAYKDVDAVPGSLLLSQTKYEYDSTGRLTKTIVADSDQPFQKDSTGVRWIGTHYYYDAYGRKTKTVEDEGGLNLTTVDEYNNQDEIVRTILPDGTWTKTIRDGQGRQSKTILGFQGSTPANELTTSYTYYPDGQVETVTDPAGSIVTYTYDPWGRVEYVIQD